LAVGHPWVRTVVEVGSLRVRGWESFHGHQTSRGMIGCGYWTGGGGGVGGMVGDDGLWWRRRWGRPLGPGWWRRLVGNGS
jgi:hypothetical protein